VGLLGGGGSRAAFREEISKQKKLMFSFGYNYFVFFLNPEIIVMVCFFFFFFFLVMSEKGKFGSYLQEISIEARSKMYKQLARRVELIQELGNFFDTWSLKTKQFTHLNIRASIGILEAVKAASNVVGNCQKQALVLYTLQALETETQYFALQIRLYLTQDLF
jgi:hypothetical protein